MMNKFYLDSNVFISSFAKEVDYNANYNCRKLFDIIQKKKKIFYINLIVLIEIYHVLCKKMKKKICKKLKTKQKDINAQLKDEKFVGHFNSIFILICQEASEYVVFEDDYALLTESILKYKISPMDYLIANRTRGAIITCDTDLSLFLDNKNKLGKIKI